MKNKPTIAISPISHGYLTKGKEYEITFIDDVIQEKLGYYFHIIDDEGDTIRTIEHKSSHTNNLSWTLK